MPTNVSPAGEILHPIMRGAAIDYKATAHELASLVLSLRASLAQEVASNDSLILDLTATRTQVRELADDCISLHKRQERLRTHWSSIFHPKDLG